MQFCILHDTTCIIYLLPEMQKVLPNPIEAEENQESSVQLSLKQQMDLAIQQSMSDEVGLHSLFHCQQAMTMRNQRLRRSKLNSLYSRRRAFEDDASSLLTTISSQFRRHLSGRNVHFLQLASVASCARKFARECRTNHWTLCASYAHTILLRGLLLIVINLNKPNSCS